MISLIPIISYPDARQYIEAFADKPKNDEFFRRLGPKFTWCNDASIQQMFSTSYFIREEERIVGIIAIVQTEEQSKSAEFGLLADKLKYAQDAIQLLSEYIFDYMGYNKLWCRIVKSVDMKKRDLGFLLSMGGFKHEGTLRDNCYSQGRYHDEVVYSKLRKEWK